MDQPQSTTLAGVFAQVPDARHRRGTRPPWTYIWTIICTAILSGQRTPHAIAHWATLHAVDLVARLQPQRPQVPSEATFRRALRQIDRTKLEEHLTHFTQNLAPPPPPLDPLPPAPAAAAPPPAPKLEPSTQARCRGRPLMAKPCAAPGCMGRARISSPWYATPAPVCLLSGRSQPSVTKAVR